MKIPDIIGFTLGEAKVLMQEAGIESYSIKVTAAPRLRNNIEHDGNQRVIRIKETDDKKVELLICKPL